jgi:hypothetical protein
MSCSGISSLRSKIPNLVRSTEEMKSLSLLTLPVLLMVGCVSHQTKIIDSEGAPVLDATMRFDHPSFNGRELKSNNEGVIEYSKPRHFDVVQVIVDSPTKGSAFLGYPPPEVIELDGSRWEDQFNLNIQLTK